MNTEQLKETIEQWQDERSENRSVIAFTAETEVGVEHDQQDGLIVQGTASALIMSITDFISNPEYYDVFCIIQEAVCRARILIEDRQKGGEQ